MPRERRELPWLCTREGIYYANWYEPPAEAEGVKHRGRTRAVSLHTENALEAANRFAAFLQQGRTIYAASVETLGLSVSKMLDDYEAEHVGPKVVDKARQRAALHYLRAYFGLTKVADLDIPASRGYAEARRSGAIGGGERSNRGPCGSDATIRRELKTLVAAINHARRWKRLNGADPIVELTADTPPDENKWLTRAEVKAVHEAATGLVRDFITLAYYTAARRASIETLRVEQVNLATKRVNLRKTGERITGKVKPLLAIHPATTETLRRLVTDAKDGWLFSEGFDAYMPFRRACHAAGIDEARSHPHVLRHSRATHLLQDGVSLYDVAKLLGDTVATVERVYGHHCPDHNEANGVD